MITITAKIYVGKDNGTISTVQGDISGNNVSSTMQEIVGAENVNIQNPFILGYSKLGDGSTYVNKLPYFMGQLSNENGIFTSPYTITISGSNIKGLIIEFDTLNRAHPNSIIVDGQTYVDDDAQFDIGFDTAQDYHNIQINNWNKPNSPLIITSIYTDFNIEIDNHNLLRFDGSIFDKGSIEYPDYGIISNTASLSFNDLDLRVIDLIQNKILHSGIKISIMSNNTTSNTNNEIAITRIEDLTYDNNNKIVDLSLKDNLEKWQDINVAPIYYTPTVSSEQPLSYIYKYLYDITIKNGFNMISLAELDETTKDILEQTMLSYPLLESSNLWDEWDKLCQVTLSNIYVDNKGIIIFKHSV